LILARSECLPILHGAPLLQGNDFFSKTACNKDKMKA